ncbi:N-acetyl-gamma-glutamyl-phosphate reductase [Kroppenstedtia guangzhouensis]|uniref:N-acetyl-gamma-glutamyl-phosphate reductase n=1 Tax=Kroppenstedtia guangzhouensis TaxID=1274356 RepID=A0ABQ1GK16_9BACL|nr:N-acetyl-gamma-glutamyl-phosphate reductase [Kroppenstedtia guangzhouensis]GGA45337.1 N-acetyl-gamma-glutamyl-phosphate reductase [Kroppenstedtia guangzhouensis]
MKVAVVGATGYGSAELIRILHRHPYVELTQLISSSTAGGELKEVFSHLSHLSHSLTEWDEEAVAEEAEAVFFAAPAGISSRLAPPLAEKGVLVIDLAGDFRLGAEEYRRWYGAEPPAHPWLERAVYGLSEWSVPAIRQAELIANPGCYPTATLLALLPLLQAGSIADGPVTVDAKSGISGAGRGLKLTSLFSEVNENLFPYQVGVHRHTPEIEEHAYRIGGRETPVIFIPQVVPMSRGILVTLYAPAADGWTTARLMEMAKEVYRKAPFVRVRGEGAWPRTKDVQGSNFCDIGFHVDERTGMLVGMAAIDNLVKGAAGQAVQNLNLRMGWPETAGLDLLPQYP